MKMIQTLYPCNQAWTEVFYDGELRVVDNLVEIPKGREHWHDILLVERGFEDYVEPQTEAPSSSKRKTVKETSHD